jgi:riboflavin kinase / FMN adenylyltransferase
MEIFRSIEEAHGHLRDCAVAIGNFDGVHLGHRRLLDTAKALARAGDRKSALLTFEPHPASVLSPQFAPPRIATLPRKIELLRETGIDAVVLQPFDKSYAASPADDFVRRDLVLGLQAADVVVGHDFTFGKGRAGNVAMLAALAGDALRIHTVPAVTADGLVVSSSKIRELVLEGRVGPAARLLGRPFLLDGTVVPGRGRGRTIGIPTANVAPDTALLPATGVYAVLATAEGLDGVYGGAANIGVKPTFGTEEQTVEVHLFDVSADLYGKRVAVGFLERLRGEHRFSGPAELVAQIHKDIAAARTIAAAHAGAAFAPVAAGA